MRNYRNIPPPPLPPHCQIQKSSLIGCIFSIDSISGHCDLILPSLLSATSNLVACVSTFSVGSNVPPDSTSTPRSSDSFAAYARDILARNERHIQTIIARSNTTSDDLRDQDPSFDPSEWSLSETPSSLQSTDLDSFLNSSTSSLARSTHTFASSRPISSQDIKARIARRMLEKSKAKTSQK